MQVVELLSFVCLCMSLLSQVRICSRFRSRSFRSLYSLTASLPALSQARNYVTILSMSSPEAKRQRTDAQYEILYHPGIPGRAEHIRLAFHAAGVPYTDIANEDPPTKDSMNGYGIVKAACDPESTGDDNGNLPSFAPPMLKIKGARKDGKDLIIHQTPNILLYIGSKLDLVGSEDEDLYYVNQITLTALDFNNECHDTHHPVALMEYYEGR